MSDLKIAGQFPYVGISIHARDERELPWLLHEAVEGIAKTLPGCEAVRRKDCTVTEVSLMVGEWAKAKQRRLTFEELVSELRKHA